MHSKYTNQQEEIALKEFERTGSISATIQKLGYPSPATLYRWSEHQKAGLKNWHGPLGQLENDRNKTHSCNTAYRSRHPSAELKLIYFIVALNLEKMQNMCQEKSDIVNVAYTSGGDFIWKKEQLVLCLLRKGDADNFLDRLSRQS